MIFLFLHNLIIDPIPKTYIKIGIRKTLEQIPEHIYG